MSFEASIQERADTPVIGIKARTSLPAIGRVISDAIGRLIAYAGEMGARPAGPPGTLYLDADLDKVEDLEIEVFVPVDRRLAGRGDIHGRVLEGGKFAVALHQGAFDQVGRVYPQLAAWMEERGLQSQPPAREVYLHKADVDADCRTEVLLALK